jgi:hypothetical protein
MAPCRANAALACLKGANGGSPQRRAPLLSRSEATAWCAAEAEARLGGRQGTAGTLSAVTRRVRSSPRAGAAQLRSATAGPRWPAEASGRGLRAALRPGRRGRDRLRLGGGTGAGLLRGGANRAVTNTARNSARGLRQLLDEFCGSGVVQVSSCFGAQDASRVVRDGGPVVEEVPGAVGEEHVPGVVGRAGLAVEDLRYTARASALATR